MVTKTKKYKDTTGEERVASAEKMKKEEFNPMDALRKLVTPKQDPVPETPPAGLPKDYKKGGMVKSPKNKSASSRADGCAIRGKTKA